jgi:hypothetical protein
MSKKHIFSYISASSLLTNSIHSEFTAHRSIEIGNSMDSLRAISVLNDIEDINETQEFQIRDFKYLVDGETLDNSPRTNGDLVCSSSENKYEPINSCNIRDDTHEETFTLNSASNSASDSLSCDHRYLRIKFARTADFYGRITIYNLEILGHEIDSIK